MVQFFLILLIVLVTFIFSSNFPTAEPYSDCISCTEAEGLCNWVSYFKNLGVGVVLLIIWVLSLAIVGLTLYIATLDRTVSKYGVFFVVCLCFLQALVMYTVWTSAVSLNY